MLCVKEVRKILKKQGRPFAVKYTWCAKHSVKIINGNSYCDKHAKEVEEVQP